MPRRSLLVALAIAVVTSTVPGVALAQEQANVAAELRALEEKLTELSAARDSDAETIEELSARLTMVREELETLRRQQRSVPDAVGELDELSVRLDALARGLDELRTEVAAIEAPRADLRGTATPGPPTYRGGLKSGLSWATGDGRYSLVLGGYIHPRFELRIPGAFEDVERAQFRLRRARLAADGHVLSKRLRYGFLIDFTVSDAPLLDGFIDYQVIPEVAVRAGQFKVPYLRDAIADSPELAFPVRTLQSETWRYERDQGVMVHGRLLDDRLAYAFGIFNGGGRNQFNDNIDFLEALRVDIAILGRPIEFGSGDYEAEQDPRLTIGGGVTHDLVSLPERVAGVEVGRRDVDGDGDIDNVRVFSTSGDARFRLQGLELAGGAHIRHERWGTILLHGDNAPIANLVGANVGGKRTFFGMWSHALYFIIPKRLQAGGRFSFGELPVLPLGNRQVLSAAPIDDELVTAEALLQWHDARGYRQLGLIYRLSVFPAAPADTTDTEHFVFLSGQVKI